MKHFLMIGSLILLAACAPYIDTRREAGVPYPVGQSTKDVIAICYNPWTTNDDTLLQMANAACGNKKYDATRTETVSFNCTLTTPDTAFYRCRP